MAAFFNERCVAQGLLLGTKMYYAFTDDAINTEAKFTLVMDSLCREIGERGKAALSEGVPPASASEPAVVSAQTSTLTQATIPRSAESTSRSFSSSVQASSSAQMTEHGAPAMIATTTFAEMAAFFREERAIMETRMTEQRQELEDMFSQQRQELETKLVEMATPHEAVTDDQLLMLHARFDSLHVAKLLTDEVRSQFHLFTVAVCCAAQFLIQRHLWQTIVCCL